MKRVKDPVHDHIEVDDAALALVDLPVFQRLRRIRQTGTAHLVYPGANHTRFEHSLGAFHLAGLAARALGLPQDETAILTRAALLHDVGHGPFSHISEPLLERHLKVSHEELSARLVRGPLAPTLEAAGTDPRAVADLVLGDHALHDAISGPLDVDRIDYLLRDGHYTGVATSVDAVRIVSHFVRVRDGIAIRQDAVGAAETLLVTRFAMHAAVYHHHTCRAGELLLQHATDDAIASGALDPALLPAMDDVALVACLRDAGGTASALLERIEQRRLYKVAVAAPYRLVEPRFLAANAGDPARLERIAADIATRAGAAPHEVLVDLPPVPTLPEVDARVVDADGAVRPLSEVSTLVSALERAQLDHLHLRVYAPEHLRDDVAKAAPSALALERPLDRFGPGPGDARPDR